MARKSSQVFKGPALIRPFLRLSYHGNLGELEHGQKNAVGGLARTPPCDTMGTSEAVPAALYSSREQRKNRLTSEPARRKMGTTERTTTAQQRHNMKDKTMGSIKVTISELAAASKLASRDMASGGAVFDRNLAVASGIMHHSATGWENIPSDVTAAAAEYFLVAGIKHLSTEDIDRVASIGRSIRTLGSMLTSTEHEHLKHAGKVLSLTADIREVAMGAALMGNLSEFQELLHKECEDLSPRLSNYLNSLQVVLSVEFMVMTFEENVYRIAKAAADVSRIENKG